MGSVVALTNAAAGLVQTYSYDSFGNITATINITQPFTYTGREYDTETGLHFYRARYYDARSGRFLQRDPIGFKGGDVDLHAYVKNNPVTYTDPDGLVPKAGIPNFPWIIPDPPPCDPFKWCQDKFEEMQIRCLGTPAMCMTGARNWYNACAAWAAPIPVPSSPNCVCNTK